MTNEDTQAKPIGQLLHQTLETLESQGTVPTIPQPQKPKPKTDKVAWLSRWIKLDPHTKDIVALQDAVFDFCCGYAANPRRGGRLLIYGSNGTGKSHTAKSVYRWADRIQTYLPFVPRMDSFGTPSPEYRHWPKVVDGFKNDQWDLEDLFTANLLVLDDIGAEHDPSRVGIEKLYMLLDAREFRWTLVTTNILPEAWEQKFERRICDRLFRNFTHVDLTETPSYVVVNPSSTYSA